MTFEQLFSGRTVGERCRIYNDVIRKLADSANIPHAISCVQWVHISDVVANDYNPNKVAEEEMKLLAKSIRVDSYTQPVVVTWDKEQKKYVVIDGFHRYSIMKLCPDVAELTEGYLPVVVLQKTLAERMAATVRHNRARGTHSVQGMSNMVYKMLQEGLSDAEVCNSLGLDAEELVRLKHITGYAKLYQNVDYSRAWAFNTPRIDKEKEAKQMVQDVIDNGGFEEE